ncbi:MAG: hypothetical protein C4289_05235, partial [Chloroflexota bacterium]
MKRPGSQSPVDIIEWALLEGHEAHLIRWPVDTTGSYRVTSREDAAQQATRERMACKQALDKHLQQDLLSEDASTQVLAEYVAV